MSIAPPEMDTDTIEALDFDKARACEHSAHTKGDYRHTDGEEMYVLILNNCGCYSPGVRIHCGLWVKTYTERGDLISLRCPSGLHMSTPAELYKPIGPVE